MSFAETIEEAARADTGGTAGNLSADRRSRWGAAIRGDGGDGAAIEEATRSLEAGKGMPLEEVRQRFLAKWASFLRVHYIF